MEVPPENETTPEVKAYLKTYKEGHRLKAEQWEQVRNFLATVENAKELLMEEMGYAESEYDNLKAYFSRHGWQLGQGVVAPPEGKGGRGEPIAAQIAKTVTEQEKQKAIQMATELVEEQMVLGNIVLTFRGRVGEIQGYDMGADGKLDLPRFAHDAIKFFLDNHDKIEALKLDADASKGIARMMLGFRREDGTEVPGVVTRLSTRLYFIGQMVESLMREKPEWRMRLLPLLAALKFKGTE